jgi:hypothetical protein
MSFTLRDLIGGPPVEINLHVRAEIVAVSDAHGFCVRLLLERRDYATKAPGDAIESDVRTVWVDEDEIIEIQP